MLLASGVESLLRAGVFGLVLSQYTFGGSILPFTFTYAITYAVFAFGSPLSVAAAGRFSGLQFARINIVILLILYALLIGLEWSGLSNMWLIGAIVPTLVFPTIVVYRDLQHSRIRLSQQVETLVNTFVGQGLEGLAPEILAGVVVILFGRPGVLAMAALGATLAFLIILRNPFTPRAKPEGTGATLGQMLSDINTGLMLTMQRPRLVNLQLATLGANFFLGVISGLVVPLSLLRGDGRPDVLLWIQGGALISLMIGLRVFQTWKNWLARPSIFFGGFVATGLLSLCVVALVAPVGVWAAAYGLLQVTTLCAILPLFTLNRRAVPRSEITSIVGAADLGQRDRHRHSRHRHRAHADAGVGAGRSAHTLVDAVHRLGAGRANRGLLARGRCVVEHHWSVLLVGLSASARRLGPGATAHRHDASHSRCAAVASRSPDRGRRRVGPGDESADRPRPRRASG